MKTIAIIPARAGSKGLPGKNKKYFAGKRLIEWTIEAALNAKTLNYILVSTDDWDIIEIAKRCGLAVPFLRPAELAKDVTPTIDVVIHALREVGRDDFTHCCLLQPTSPLRTSTDIDDACNIAARNPGKSVISVTENREYPFIVSRGAFGEIKSPRRRKQMRRQNIELRYHINGAIYVNPVSTLLENKSFYYGHLIPSVLPKFRSLQIDDQFDFDIAEYVMTVLQNRATNEN